MAAIPELSNQRHSEAERPTWRSQALRDGPRNPRRRPRPRGRRLRPGLRRQRPGEARWRGLRTPARGGRLRHPGRWRGGGRESRCRCRCPEAGPQGKAAARPVNSAGALPERRRPGLLAAAPRHVFEGRIVGALAVGHAGRRSTIEPEQSLALAARGRGYLGAPARSHGLDLGRVRATCASRSDQEAEECRRGERTTRCCKLSEALFAQDIELLRSNEKLGKIEKLKNDFIEKMSRELRTPLNSIIEAIISVLAGENDALSESGQAGLRNALDDGTAFLRTLQNILDLWRIKQNELPVEIQEVNFARWSRRRSSASRTTHRRASRSPSRPRTLRGAASRRSGPTSRKINQILFLLLDNAAKFTEKRQDRDRGVTVDRDRLLFEVRDTGIGICPDDQQLIFDEFFQVDEPSSQKLLAGAGLGLALVRDLIVLLEGEISVTERRGPGASSASELRIQIVAGGRAASAGPQRLLAERTDSRDRCQPTPRGDPRTEPGHRPRAEPELYSSASRPRWDSRAG